MEKAIEVTDRTMEEILPSDKPILLDFWAEWCGPCKMIGPMIDELSVEYKGKVIVGKVDVDANPELTVRFGVRAAPTLLIIVQGKVVERQVGAVSKMSLLKKLVPYLEAIV